MKVITISRQVGCGGYAIAEKVADQMGFTLAWRDVINEAARRAGAPEAALAAIDELRILGFCPSEEACQAYHEAVRQIILDIYTHGGAVLLGRGGQAILQGLPGVLHVRLWAPEKYRVNSIALRQNISQHHALEQVHAIDRFRKNYLKRFYNIRWDDPCLYDLVINTSVVSHHDAAEMIVLAARSMPHENDPLNN